MSDDDLGLGADAPAVAAALLWLADVMERHRVPWQIVGGFAARIHGARREHEDIDVFAPFVALDRATDDLWPHMLHEAEHHVDDHWDITFCKLDHDGVRIEIGDSVGVRIKDRERGRRVPLEIDYATSERHEVLGTVVPVMPRRDLVVYKRMLARPPDVEDVAQLTRRQGTARRRS